MVLKLRAAIEARRDSDLLIIARTDARAVEGLDAAIARSKAYVAAGADMLFFEAPESFEDMCKVAEAVKAPLLLNMFGGGKTPAVPMKELQRIGYRVVIFPSHLQRASIRAMQKALDILKRDDLSDGEDTDLMVTFNERDRIVGLHNIHELEKRYLTLSNKERDV
jgi:2-methylisocitrate lyase-like PEP mutase family enzyme